MRWCAPGAGTAGGSGVIASAVTAAVFPAAPLSSAAVLPAGCIVWSGPEPPEPAGLVEVSGVCMSGNAVSSWAPWAA